MLYQWIHCSVGGWHSTAQTQRVRLIVGKSRWIPCHMTYIKWMKRARSIIWFHTMWRKHKQWGWRRYIYSMKVIPYRVKRSNLLQFRKNWKWYIICGWFHIDFGGHIRYIRWYVLSLEGTITSEILNGSISSETTRSLYMVLHRVVRAHYSVMILYQMKGVQSMPIHVSIPYHKLSLSTGLLFQTESRNSAVISYGVWSSSSRSISSSGRRCRDVSAKLMPVLRHSACCCRHTKPICDVFLPSLSWLSSD